ncbi:MAG: GNAT family N-acetyltransferase [Saprospiraceae bacterium]|nr:GNAT family N-acetyltransferase [Pyrinomonadaceae bacterium]
MSIEIREATEQDLAGIIGLMREFAEYEKLAEYFDITEVKLSRVLFGDGTFVECLVAADGENLMAYALFYPCFASFRGESGFYLEDIFITADHRGRSVGEIMLRKIAAKAKARGYERIDFQVLDWNKPAINFYEKLGATGNFDESHFKFSGKAFENLAAPD